MTDENLLHKMSQLSANATKNKECLMKEIKVPDYLTKGNKSFQQMMHQALSNIITMAMLDDDDDSTNKLEELRKIAILIYQIMIIQTYELLWAAYLQSGIGQLIIPSKTKLSYSTTLRVWPKEIKTMVLLSKNMDKTNENESCLKFVDDYLNELDHQLKQYQMELNMKANSFQGYTLSIQILIETYIEQNLHSLRMEIEHQVERIHFDYHIQALKLEYYRHNSNDYQKQIMKEMCQSKYAQETSEEEYNFSKQQITYYNASNQSFDSSSIAHSSLIDSVQDPKIRQGLFQQYKDITEQSRANLFTLYMKTAEEQREEYKNKHETNLKKM